MRRNGAGITIVGASAGSGKTYRLTQEVTGALAASGRERVDVTGLVAVTFTKKARSELEARIRHTLIEEEAYEEALRLPLAYLGTVHAVALRLLQEFALDAGLSPNVDVVSGNETKLLRQAFERTLDEAARGHLDDLAARLELGIDHRTRRADWVTPVADIMDLARSNRIPAGDLPAMGERSAAGLLALLPSPAKDGTALDAALARELAAAVAALAAADDGRRNTAEARLLMEAARSQLADGELRWSSWAKLAMVAPSKACERWVLGLRAAAARYEEHPQLHDEIRAMTRAVFDAACMGLVAYQEWKRKRRVLDYVDMLDGALDLVEHPRVRAELSRRLQLVVVDEFQDTSPIQLALFVRLHALAGRSIWVGDRKQCIFEYAGADPTLMDAVADWVSREGGTRDRLDDNHRSRPELVHACSELFAAALSRHGFTRDEVVVQARRSAHPGLAPLPPLGLWTLDVENKADDAEAVAEGVRRTLAAPSETPVLDRTTKEVRPLRPGDVAILVATNEWASCVAKALAARGVRAAIARAGLFETPEGSIVDASLRWLLDGSDGLAASVIDALSGWEGRGPDAWLGGRLDEVSRKPAGSREDDEEPGAPQQGWRGALAALRSDLTIASPVEVLDGTLSALDATQLCARWPDPAQRISNLDALRAAAVSYEARCAQEREAATVAGMLRYFDLLRSPSLKRDEMLPSDQQHVPADDGAVVICTYHKAKGLEWPVVVLANLDRGERRDAFEVTPESVGASFDPERPLANRGIRYWPWPLGATKNVRLAAAAEQSAEGRLVSMREDKERARLLYVGFTRARDHLIIAARPSGRTKTAWLDALCDADGAPIVELPASADDGDVAETRIRLADGGALRIPTRVWRLDALRKERPTDDTAPAWFARPDAVPGPPVPRYRIAPSEGASDWPEVASVVARSRIGVIERLPAAMTIAAGMYAFEVVGDAMHGFLAADVEGLTGAARLERASALIDGAGLAAIIAAASLVRAGDGLRTWVARRWPRASWHREIAIEGWVESDHGERRISGIIDLLLETPEGYVVIDHKTFPAAAESAWRAKCVTFIPQLAAYATLLDAAGEKRVTSCWVHLPIGGAMVEIALGVRARA